MVQTMIKQVVCVLAFSFILSITIRAQYSWAHLPTVQQTAFKKDSFNIVKFGAVAGGQTLATAAINKAISTCSQKGGGVVVVPEGLWLTGPIEMKSNVNLHLKTAAVLLFTTDKDQYTIVEGTYEGKAAARNQSPIWAKDQQNIAITGNGIVDGNGDAWRAVAKWQMTKAEWAERIASGGVLNKDSSEWFPSEQFKNAKEGNVSMLIAAGQSPNDFKNMKDFLRPNLVVINNCKKVLLEGVVFQNSAAWCLHPLLCEDLTIRNVKIKNPEYAQNGDGMDIESCKNFLVEGCIMDVGDDAICIKSGKDEEGRKRGKPTENGIIRNNIVYKAHGGFVVGSEMSGGARNLFVEHCSFIGTEKGLRFKSTRGRGGVVENIYARHLVMKDIRQEAIFFDLFYFVKFATDSKRDERPVVNEGTPIFRHMEFEDIACVGAKTGIFIRGLSEMPVQDIYIHDAFLKAEQAVSLTDAKNIRLENISFEVSEKYPVYTADNTDGLATKAIKYQPNSLPLLDVKGNRSNNINLCCANAGSASIKAAADVPSSAVHVETGKQ
ncbi:MAG: glycoside hydrolase family 28 protein [Chitinophagaceae bacterium]